MTAVVDPYRSVFVPKASVSNPSSIGSPWLLLAEQEIAEWRLRHPEATTTSPKVARCLAWLEQEFGHGAPDLLAAPQPCTPGVSRTVAAR